MERARPTTSNEQTALQLYLRGLNEPLLTKEQEFELGAAMWNGYDVVLANLKGDVKPPDSLPLNDELDDYIDRSELMEVDAKLLEEAVKARDRLVTANLRLVVSIARKYANPERPLLDTIQDGNLGLIEGVSKFDHRKGFKLSTYASWWIRQSITRRWADTSRTIRLPVHVHDTLSRESRVALNLAQELQREPTDAEVAERMDISLERLRELRMLTRDKLSLDAPVGDEEDGYTLADSQRSDQRFEDQVHDRLEGGVLTEALIDVLNDREREVIVLRFGLIDGHHRTLEEVASNYGLTRERIRQIEAKALKKLRLPLAGAMATHYSVDSDI